MTSKEKLDYIYENIPIKEHHDELKQCFEDLEKELEVLEIIKENEFFWIEDNKLKFGIQCDTECDLEYDGYFLNGEHDLKKLKEWLE